MIYLLLTLFLAVALYFGKIKLLIDLEIKEFADSMRLVIKISLLKYKLKLLYLKIEEEFSFSKLRFEGNISQFLRGKRKIKESLGKDENNRRDINNIFNFLNKTKEMAKNSREILFLIEQCDFFLWKTSLGLHNPIYTGILTGLLWTFKSPIIILLQNKVKLVDRTIIEVKPNFNQITPFFMKIKGIFSFKLGKIIFMGIRIIYFQIKRRLGYSGKPSD